MAFKMNPKSPLLMKAMGVSPAKTSSPAKQRSGGISRDEEARGIEEETRRVRGRGEALRPERGMKKELSRIKKKKVAVIEAEPVKKVNAEEAKVEKKELTAKQKALKKLREAQGDNEVANIEKETSKVKKNSTKKRKQAKRKDSQAERRREKTKRLEERIERRKNRRSPAKQTSTKSMTQAKKKPGRIMSSAERKSMKDKSVVGGGNVAKPPKNQKKSKYDMVGTDSPTAPRRGSGTVKGEKFGESPAKQSKG